MKVDFVDVIAAIVAIIAIVAVAALAIQKDDSAANVGTQNQELCAQMGEVMETEKAVAVGSMCCTEYTCLEIKP